MFSVNRWLGGGGVALVAVLQLASGLRAQSVETRSHSLQQAISIALESNRNLREAQLGLMTADQQVREAWGSLYPTIDASL